MVYFIPSDKDTLENYQKRISGIILHTQAWFKKEMDRNGFGEKTFGLLVDDKNAQNVKIIVINGQCGIINDQTFNRCHGISLHRGHPWW